jgi:hypothetical protein
MHKMTMWSMALLLVVSLTGSGSGDEGAATPTPATNANAPAVSSSVTGDIGVSPIARGGITADADSPTTADLTTAVSDMETAKTGCQTSCSIYRPGRMSLSMMGSMKTEQASNKLKRER